MPSRPSAGLSVPHAHFVPWYTSPFAYSQAPLPCRASAAHCPWYLSPLAKMQPPRPCRSPATQLPEYRSPSVLRHLPARSCQGQQQDQARQSPILRMDSARFCPYKDQTAAHQMHGFRGDKPWRAAHLPHAVCHRPSPHHSDTPAQSARLCRACRFQIVAIVCIASTVNAAALGNGAVRSARMRMYSSRKSQLARRQEVQCNGEQTCGLCATLLRIASHLRTGTSPDPPDTRPPSSLSSIRSHF